MDTTTVVVGVATLVLGWALKSWVDSWTWRRQQVLAAYLELLDATDRCSNEIGRLWNSGHKLEMRTENWVDRAFAVRDVLESVDRASGKVMLVARSSGAEAAIELYIGCERMYRRAIAKPPDTWEHYQAAAVDMVKAYHSVVDRARQEMSLQRWQDRLPGHESRFALTARRLEELERVDPLPRAQDAGPPTTMTKGFNIGAYRRTLESPRGE
jgi:hypothetical protein